MHHFYSIGLRLILVTAFLLGLGCSSQPREHGDTWRQGSDPADTNNKLSENEMLAINATAMGSSFAVMTRTPFPRRCR